VSADGQARSERVSLPRALAVSIALHAVLLLILAFLPSRPREPRADETLAVTFDLRPPAVEPVPPPDDDLFRPRGPERERPDETSVNPAPSALGQVAPLPSPPVPEPAEPRPEVPRPQDRPDLRPPSEREDEAADANDDDEGGALSGIERPGPRPDLRERIPRDVPERIDLGRAIRDFRSDPGVTALPTAPAPQGNPEGIDLPLGTFETIGFGDDVDLAFETREFDWSDYSRQVYKAIWKAWHERMCVRFRSETIRTLADTHGGQQVTAYGQQVCTIDDFAEWSRATGSGTVAHAVLIQFTIERDGDVAEVRIVRSDGNAAVDTTSSETLLKVVLPPLPENFPKERERVRARFLVDATVPALRHGLGAMKARGYF